MRDDTTDIGRRSALGRIATAAALAGAAPLLGAAATTRTKAAAPHTGGGRLRQSLSRWTSKAPLPELCTRLKALGFAGVDLLYADEWSVVTDHGLAVSMGYPARRDNFIEMGFNDPANLDDGNMWPTSFALTKITAAEEKKISTLVKKAAG